MTVTEGSNAPPFDIDILDPRLYDDPWEAYRWLRHNAPIWWDERNELYVISRHEDVSHISRHQELCSAVRGVRPKGAETKVGFEELFRRLRDIRAVDTDALERGASTLVLALNRLPAVFTPETAVPSS